MGGLECTVDAECIDKTGKAIPGLYVAGEVGPVERWCTILLWSSGFLRTNNADPVDIDPAYPGTYDGRLLLPEELHVFYLLRLHPLELFVLFLAGLTTSIQ